MICIPKSVVGTWKHGYAHPYPSVYRLICFAYGYCVSRLCARVKVKVNYCSINRVLFGFFRLITPAHVPLNHLTLHLDKQYIHISIYASPRRPETCITDERMVLAGVTLPNSLAFTNISWQLHKVMPQLHRPLPSY